MTSPSKIRLGTRASALARWQANWVAQTLRTHGVEVEIVFISTQGDVKSGPIGAIGTQGVFTKELQNSLLSSYIDLAVHSLKDLPTDPVDGLTLGAVPERESPHDAFISTRFATFAELPTGAHVGTGSTRRRAQLLHARSDLRISDVRGNLDTRLRKLDEGDYDAIILAEAGLTRLGWRDRIAEVLPYSLMLPAVGQGALGLECRADDAITLRAIQLLDHAATHASVLAERVLLAGLRGGCLAPVGARAEVRDETLELEAVVLSADGHSRLAARSAGDTTSAAQIGAAVAEDLLSQGAAKLIASARQ